MGTPSGPVGALLLLVDGEGAVELGVEFAGKRRAKWFVKIVFQLKENSLTIVVHG